MKRCDANRSDTKAERAIFGKEYSELKSDAINTEL